MNKSSILTVTLSIPFILSGIIIFQSIEFIWLIILITLILLGCISQNTKVFMLSSFCVYLSSVLGFIANFIIMKADGVGFHHEKVDELIWILGIHTLFVVFIIAIELLIKQFMDNAR